MVGFSAFVSVGSQVDVGWGDLIYHLGNDPKTRSIVIYMESIGNARSFISAAREVALNKPIIVIKPGRSAAAPPKPPPRTPVRSPAVTKSWKPAFRRSGVLRVNNIADLFYMAEVLLQAAQPPWTPPHHRHQRRRPGRAGNRRPDHGAAENWPNCRLPPWKLTTPCCRPTWSHNNPVDIIGDASPRALRQGPRNRRQRSQQRRHAGDPHPAGHDRSHQDRRTAHPRLPNREGKPVLASWMGGVDVAAGEEVLNRANIPTFPYPDTAARAFNYMWQYSYNLKSLYETPAMPEDSSEWTPDRKLVEDIIGKSPWRRPYHSHRV